MKKGNVLLTLIMVSLFSLTLAACKKTTEPTTTAGSQTTTAPTTEVTGTNSTTGITTEAPATSIEDVLNNCTNNQDVKIKGVVYGVTQNGYYVSDSANGHIFVLKASSIDLPSVGDEVKVTGKFGYVSNFPQIKAVSEQVVTGTGMTSAMVKKTMEVAEIATLDQTAKTGVYGELVEVTGSITKDIASRFVLQDEDGNQILFDSYSDTTKLTEFLDKRVTLDAVVYKVTDSTWQISYCAGMSIVESPVTFEELVAKAEAEIDSLMPPVVHSAIILPTEHATIAGLLYDWDVAEDTYATVDKNIVTFKENNEEDVTITFVATISYGEDSTTKEFYVICKALKNVTVSELMEDAPTIEGSKVIVTGVISAITRNQGGNQASLILVDKVDGTTVEVDFFSQSENYIAKEDEEFTSLAIGNEITVKGAFTFASRPYIQNVEDLTVVEAGTTVNRFLETAYELKDEASYDYLRENIADFSGKLVKFVTPYMNYSVSEASKLVETSWVRLGYSEDSANATSGKRCLAFLLVANNNSLGTSYWHKALNIPYVNDGAETYGVSFYAYCTYISDTYIQFIIPDTTCIVDDLAYRYEVEMSTTIPTSVEDGTITLPATTSDGKAITWTSSNAQAISTEGVVEGGDTVQVVTLTAAVEGITKTISFEVTVQANVPLTVTEALTNAADASIVKVTGVVVGFASDGNSAEGNKGLMIMDPANSNIIIVKGIGTLLEQTYPEYTVDGTKIAVGQVVTITGVYDKTTANVNMAEGKIKLGETVSSITYTPAYTATTQAELEAIFAESIPYGKIIKISGSETNMMYLTGSASKLPSNYRITLKKGTAAADLKFGVKTLPLSIKSDLNEANAKEAWYDDFELTTTRVSYEDSYVGDIYVVVTYTTSAYYQASIINFDNWTLAISPERVNNKIKAQVEETSIEAFADIKLPATAPNGEAITWTSSNTSVIDLANSTITRTLEEQKVTLNGEYTLYGKTQTVSIEFTVVGETKPAPLTVTQVLAKADGDVVEMTGVVIAYAHDGNGNTMRFGIVVADPANGNVVVVNQFGDAINYPTFPAKDGKTVAIGDEVIVNGTYAVNKDANGGTSVKGNSVYQTSVEVVKSGVTVDYSKFECATATNSTELETILSGNYYAKVIKIVGSADNKIAIGQSSSTVSSCNFKIAFADKNNTTDAGKYIGKNISIKTTTSQYINSKWYNTYFPGITTGVANMSSSKVSPEEFTGTLYLVITHTTSSYYQATLVNAAGWSLAK